MPSMLDYHGYSMEFEWDRAYFMPFTDAYCFYVGWIPTVLTFFLFYLLFKHSPMYSREFRNALAAYHFIQIFFDIHHSYLFKPYPLFPMPIFVCRGFLCRWHASTRLLMTFTTTIAACGVFGMSIVIFMRLQKILDLNSRFRLSLRQCVALGTVTALVFLSNGVGMALFAGDDPRKEAILNRSEFLWIRAEPDALVWGEMFDTPEFDIELYYLAACSTYGVCEFFGILIYSLVALKREKKKLLKLTSLQKSKDQGNRMLQILIWGATFTFVIPLLLFIFVVKLGLPTSNAHFHSVIRFLATFAFVNNSMFSILLHLVMNRVYQKIIIQNTRRRFSMIKPHGRIFTSQSLATSNYTHQCKPL